LFFTWRMSGREGTANLFMIFAPLEGWRRVKVTARRTKVDFANCLRDLADTHFPDAEKITLVRDQLNTHGPDCLCEAFAPEEAQRILGRFEFHYTPKHGSWLDMAEIERSALFRQCLSRRIGSVEILEREVGAWGAERNESKAKVDWQLPPFLGYGRYAVGEAEIGLACALVVQNS